jgi:hypothetical protein
MKKKLVALGLMLIVAFAFAACDLGDLDEYKETKKAELTAYVKTLGEADYAVTDWVTIGQIVETGKGNIDAATTKPTVNAALATAKNGIGAILPKEKKVEEQIRKDYLVKLDDSNIKLESVYIFKRYGIYNDSHAVIIAIHGFEPPPSIDEMMIEGFAFSFNTGRHITAWKDGEFFSLQVAFDKGLLTLENIETIHSLYNS